MTALLLHDHCRTCGARVVRARLNPTTWRHAYQFFGGHDPELCTEEAGHEHQFTPPHPYPPADLVSGAGLWELPASDSVL